MRGAVTPNGPLSAATVDPSPSPSPLVRTVLRPLRTGPVPRAGGHEDTVDVVSRDVIDEKIERKLLYFVMTRSEAGLPTLNAELRLAYLAALEAEGLQLLEVVDEDTWDEYADAFWYRNNFVASGHQDFLSFVV